MFDHPANYEELIGNINFGAYKPIVPFCTVVKAKTPTDGEVVEFMKSEAGRHLTFSQAFSTMSQARLLKEEATAAQADEYAADLTRKTARFWHDVESVFGMPKDHPMAAPLRSMAWERGHSAGLSDVVACYSDLVDNLKQVITGYTFVKK